MECTDESLANDLARVDAGSDELTALIVFELHKMDAQLLSDCPHGVQTAVLLDRAEFALAHVV